MLVWRLLIHLCVLKLVVTYYVDQDCEVKSRWEGQFIWSEYHIKTWLPPEKPNVVEIKINFEGKDDDLWNDKIIISRKEFIITKLRDLKPQTDKRNISINWQDGWTDIIFRVENHYSMSFKDNTNGFEDEFQVDYSPKSVQITGSNVTLNCPSDKLVWQGDTGEVIVPLDIATHHWLSYYSNSDGIPSLTLNERRYQLGWDGKEITTIVGIQQQLPAYELHNFTVICRTEALKCSIQAGQNGTKLEDIGISKLPSSLTIKSKGKFSVLLFESNPTKSAMVQENTSDQLQEGNATVIVLILLLVAIVVGILGFVGYKKLVQVKKKSDDDIEARSLFETIPLLTDDTNKATLYNPLLEAVINNKICEFRNLAKEKKHEEDYKAAFVEAHLLCRREILKNLESPEPIDRKALIREVLQEYDRRVNKVFKAAHQGNYRRGVATLLQKYELPATIRDTSGRSLLHIIASASDSSGAPLWSVTDVKEFLKNETCYPNSVDFERKSCLHYLVANSIPVTSRSEQISSEFTWQELAEILIEFGCDPRIRDAKGLLPHEMAKRKRRLELCELLEKASKNFDNINNEEANFKKLIEFSKNGDTPALMNLMKSYQELLPLEATANPLTASATGGHLETTMLLLSTGAWICGRSAVSITPFEAANNMPSLPAIFPAVMRRECINRLRFESKKILADDKYNKLRGHLESLITNVEEGHVKIMNSRTDEESLKNTENARSLLCLAAQLGLSLTCQMFGFENVILHPLPEEEKPLLRAIQNGQKEIISLLYRDFQMSILCHIEDDKLPADFLQEVWNTEFKQLEKSFSPRASTQHKNWLEQVKRVHRSPKDAVIEKQVLAHIAEKGLVYIFHIIKQNTANFDVNATVDSVTGCTMLHIAAMYGRFSMVEYLLYDKTVDVMTTCKGGYTAAHLAAIRGNKQCLQYLQYFMQEDHGVTESETKPGESIESLLKGYGLLVQDSKLLLLSEPLGLQVLSVPSNEEKADLILENMNSHHTRNSTTSIRDLVKQYTKNEKDTIIETILQDLNGLLQLVTKADPRYKGKVVACRSNADGLCIPMESMVIYWEVNSEPFSKFKLTHKQNEKAWSISVSFENKELNNHFKQGFFTAVQRAVEDSEFKPSLIRLTYPSIKLGSIGISLYVIVHDEERMKLISVLLVPVLKTEFPKEHRLKFIHPVIKEVTDKLPIHLANSGEEEWTHITVTMEDAIRTRLIEEQRLVMIGCKLITKILYSCWWFPKLETRQHSKSWHTYSSRLGSLPDRVLASLFLEEVNSTKDGEWKPETYLDHMISIFRKAITADGNESQAPKATPGLFLDYKESSYKTDVSVCKSIVRFLEKRKAEEISK